MSEQLESRVKELEDLVHTLYNYQNLHHPRDDQELTKQKRWNESDMPCDGTCWIMIVLIPVFIWLMAQLITRIDGLSLK